MYRSRVSYCAGVSYGGLTGDEASERHGGVERWPAAASRGLLHGGRGLGVRGRGPGRDGDALSGQLASGHLGATVDDGSSSGGCNGGVRPAAFRPQLLVRPLLFFLQLLLLLLLSAGSGCRPCCRDHFVQLAELLV